MFTSEERRIFRMRVRGQEMAYDPLKVRRVLYRDTGGELPDVWGRAVNVRSKLAAGEAPEPEDFDAEEQLLTAARVAFGLDEPTQSGEGFTDSEVWTAVDQWGRWLKKASAGAGSSPTGSAATGASPGSGSSTAKAAGSGPSASPTPTTPPYTSTDRA